MSNKHRFATLSFTVALALAGVVALLWLLGDPSEVALAQSGTGVIRVAATTGSDIPACGSVISPCATIQYAVDAAGDGEVIQVATDVYTGVHGRPYPSGYPRPPVSGLITQVVYISKTVTIRGGYTTAFTDPPNPEANQTTLDAQGQGRVIFITGDISPTIEGLRFTGGDADGLRGYPWTNDDVGGGVHVINATATISNNRVFSNTADRGGGLYLHYSISALSANTVYSNTAERNGGGLCLHYSDATLSANIVTSNTADYGGGLYLYASKATLSGNTVISNTADRGGGLVLQASDATLSANTVISNTAERNGGGLYLLSSDATLTNTVVADNHANTTGSGLFIGASSPRLLHTTIARNSGGDGSGVYVTTQNGPSTVALTNTILISHSVGITVTADNTARLESTLWYSNTDDWSGPGTIITGTYNYWGDPRFDADGYHLMANSAAVDKGVNAGVTTDIDGDARPDGCFFDLGVDELITGVECKRIYLPIIMKNY